ncbi:MAG: GntR family transcriptional regulator, partial [Oscillospiraceae bacterium]
MYSIDVRSRVPIYEQLKQNIVKLISTGILDPDEQLPGVRSLARELGINPNTVQKA